MPKEEIDRRIVELLRPYIHILDIGCGDGQLVNALVCQNQVHVVGLDNSNHGFSDAKNIAKQAATYQFIDCVEGDAQQMAFKTNHFEAVILTFSLHHIEDTNLALQEIHRILAPGGKVIIGEWVVEDEDSARDGCYRFTLIEMEQMLRKTGFQEILVEQIKTDATLIVALKLTI